MEENDIVNVYFDFTLDGIKGKKLYTCLDFQ